MWVLSTRTDLFTDNLEFFKKIEIVFLNPSDPVFIMLYSVFSGI